MAELEKQHHGHLCEIGRELEDASFSGRLDFDIFRSFLQQAIDAVGADHPDL